MSETATPENEAAIADVVRGAHDAASPVEIVGGGSRAGLGRPVQSARTLSLAAHSDITLYEPGALTVVAKAGTPLAAVEAALAAENQRLTFEPMDHRPLLGTSGEPTIGGVVSAAVSGPRRVQGGACRDSLLGLRFVDGRGRVIKNGGRVMKNVTGYDLAKLFCGAHGTLGVITEIAIKVLPRNAREATLALPDLSIREAVAVMSRALGLPYDITGAAHMPMAEAGPLTLLRVEGMEAQVSYRLERLRAALKRDAEIVEGERHEALWRAVRDVTPFAGDDRLVWRLSLKPGDAPDIIETIGAGAEALLDWGGGLVWLALPVSVDGQAARVRGAVAARGGHATLVRAPVALRASVDVFQPESPAISALSRALRASFDPGRILNPGRMTA